MDIKQLKEKLEHELSEFMYKNSDLHNEFDKLFSEFNESNKDKEQKDMEKIADFSGRHTFKYIDKQLNNLDTNQRDHGKQLEAIKEDIDNLKLYIVDKYKNQEKKHERFSLFQQFGGGYVILDRKNEFKFKESSTPYYAKEILTALNKLSEDLN